jgi:hypothetical protein
VREVVRREIASVAELRPGASTNFTGYPNKSGLWRELSIAASKLNFDMR